MKNKQKAFSITEISISLVVLGVVVSGVIVGKSLIESARKNTAQELSKNSEINNIQNMTLWLDACAKEAFDSEPADNSKVSKWLDVNPNVSSQMLINATQSDASSQPVYVKNGINKLPALRFDGNDFFNFSGRNLVQTNYTIFVVEQRAKGSGDNSNRMFIGGTDNSSLVVLHIGYRRNDRDIHFGHWGHDLSVANLFPAFANRSPARVHSFVFSQAAGMKYVLNGLSSATYVDASKTSALIAFNNARIGGFRNSHYAGFIGEIIVFSRALRNQERQMVEEYLAKKWNI